MITVRFAALTVFSIAILVNCGQSFAQIERLNPNPTQPYSVGGGNADRSRIGGGAPFGRGIGPAGGTLDENPADTLLREMGGSNATRRTGRAMFSESHRRKAGYRGVTPKFEGGAVVFDRPGAYEEAIYGAPPGSYSMKRKASRRVR